MKRFICKVSPTKNETFQLDRKKKKTFCIIKGCFVDVMTTDADVHKNILFSDEPHSMLNENVNIQGCRIWSDDAQEVIIQCSVWEEGIIGWAFYRTMGNGFFVPGLEDVDVGCMLYRQRPMY